MTFNNFSSDASLSQPSGSLQSFGERNAWKPFKPAPNNQAIAASLASIPDTWALVPLQDKAPKRNGWESEPALDREIIKALILDGEEKISKKTGKAFRIYSSGYGIRTGTVSGGILAIDVDGHQAHELLQIISGGILPQTVSFCSGKPGRYQLLYQIPVHRQSTLTNFNRKPIRKWGEFESDCDLDFRYNGVQSCLPPSRHPDTGSYKWINSPVETEVAIAPYWLCNLLDNLANEEQQEKLDAERAKQEQEERRRLRKLDNPLGSDNLIDLVEQAAERLGEDIYIGTRLRKSGSKLVGKCPQHGGESGTSFQVSPKDWSWYCHGCAVGGHAVQYRYFLKGGTGTPKRQDYIAIARELIEDAGLQFPELERDPIETPEPDPELYANYEAWESQQERADEEFEKERKRQWTEAQPDRTRGEWARLSTLGLDRTIGKLVKEVCERYLNIDPDHDFLPGINVWASAMGTGKTHSMAKIVERFPEGNVFSYRNSLLQNTATRIPKVDYIHDLGSSESGKADRLLKSHSNWTALCVDSILKVRTKDVIVLEEVSKLIDHLLRGGTCKRDRAAILKAFEKHIQAAKYIFMLDADTSDIDVRYIRSLAPSKPIHIIKNVFQPWQWQVDWFVGSAKEVEEGIQNIPNDRSPIDAQILDAPAAGKKILVTTDSQVYGETIDRLLTGLYPELSGLRVDSFTKTDDAERVNAFLTDPNKWVQENDPAWVILSPTAESSLDITIDHFTDVYGVFCGTINCYSMQQMLGRYRVPVQRHVFVRERSMTENDGSRSSFAKTVLKHLHLYENETLNQIALDKYLKENALVANDGNIFTQLKALNNIADFESETWKDPHLKAWSEYKARDNYQKANLRQTLKEMLESKGHQLTTIIGRKEETACKNEREGILVERAGRIATAKDISIEEAREIQGKMSATTDERFAAEKAFLRERLPGVTLDQDFIYWCKFKERGILNQLENYFMLQNPGLSEHVDRQRWMRGLDNGSFIADIRTQSLELKTIRDLKLDSLLDGKERRADDPEVIAFHQRALDHAQQLKTALGITVKTDSDINYLIKRIAGKVAIKWSGKQYRDSDGHYRAYSAILPGGADSPETRKVLAAYATKYADFCEQQVEMSQTAPIVETTLFEQSVTKTEILPIIDVEPIGTTVKGLPPVEPEPDQLATGELREGAIARWAKKQVSIVWVALDNSIAVVRDIVTKVAYNVPPDELQLA